MPMQVTSYYHRTNPDEAGYSLGNFYEIWAACFDAAGARSVIEVGAERGRLTQELLRWAAPSGAHVTAIEPEPISDLLELTEEYPDLEIVEETSLDALAHLPIADVIVLDGDHNYYTLSGELRLIAERSERMPLLVFHDVCWPLARRDQYAAPDRIPPEHRHPYGEDIKLVPGNPGTAERGLPFEWGALEEGGPRNGVMTAIEDFMAEHDGLRLAVIPIFFGCGLLWPESADWSDAVARDRRSVGPEPDPGAGREGPGDPAGPAPLPRAGDRRALHLREQAGGGRQADSRLGGILGAPSGSRRCAGAASRPSHARSSAISSRRASARGARISADGSAAPPASCRSVTAPRPA